MASLTKQTCSLKLQCWGLLLRHLSENQGLKRRQVGVLGDQKSKRLMKNTHFEGVGVQFAKALVPQLSETEFYPDALLALSPGSGVSQPWHEV